MFVGQVPAVIVCSLSRAPSTWTEWKGPNGGGRVESTKCEGEEGVCDLVGVGKRRLLNENKYTQREITYMYKNVYVK